jgi:cytochrome b561
MTISRSFARYCREQHPGSQKKALQCILVAAVVASGVLGLLNKSELRQAVELWVNIHVMFAALLLIFVVARFHWSMTQTVLSSPSETYACYRQLKRIVYLLLYGIIAIRQLIGFLTYYWCGNAFDFDFAELQPSSNPHYFGFDPNSDGHTFIACGVLALAAVRLLMFNISTGRGKEEPVTSVPSVLKYDVVLPLAGVGIGERNGVAPLDRAPAG